MLRRNLLRSWLIASLAIVGVCTTHAQTASAYPSRPIRIVVPFAAGLSPDVVARLLAEKLSIAVGQPVTIDNKPGASGMIAAEAAAKSPGDGYTLLMSVTAVMSMNPHIYDKLPYDPRKDFKPVTHVLNVPFVIIGDPNSPYSNLADLIKAARKNPGAIDYASLGAGSQSHVAMAWLQNATDTKMTHIPFKVSPSPDIIAGRVAAYFDPIITALPLIKAGKVKALAVASNKRSPLLPDVPAVSELVPNFEANAFQGIFVPASTPDNIVAKLNQELVNIIRSPEVTNKLLNFGFVPIASTSVEFGKYCQEDYERYGKVIRDNQIKVDQ